MINYISKHLAFISNSQAQTASAAPSTSMIPGPCCLFRLHCLFQGLTCPGLAQLLLHSCCLHCLGCPLYLSINVLLKDPKRSLLHLGKQIFCCSMNILHILIQLILTFDITNNVSCMYLPVSVLLSVLLPKLIINPLRAKAVLLVLSPQCCQLRP